MCNKTMLVLISVVTLFSMNALAAARKLPGLVGVQYGSEDFTNIQDVTRLSSLERKFTQNDGYGHQWSAKWFGFIVGPASGEVSFSSEADQAMEMQIAGKIIISTKLGVTTGSMYMVKGQEYPIEISLVKSGDADNCYFGILWNLAGQAKVSVGSANLVHTMAQEQQWVTKARQAKDNDNNNDEDNSDDEIEIPLSDFGLSPSAKPASGFVLMIDLSQAKIIALNGRSKVQASAARMLSEEIDKRTRIGLDIVKQMPGAGVVTIVIGTGREVADKVCSPPAGLTVPDKTDGYAIWIDSSKRNATTICLAGHDDRGALYAVGRLLRILEMGRDKVSVNGETKIATAPKYALRGHQMGYRAKTNSYDAWTVEKWEQYYRDMIVFGLNAVEIVPPVTDDLPDSAVMPKKPLDMMIAQSKLADDYGLDLWIWYPVMEYRHKDNVSEDLAKLALKNREYVLSRLPRVNAVFVPSGDPGEVNPKFLFPHMKGLKKILDRYHPGATVWSSVQNYDDKSRSMGWTKAFYDKLRSGQADWLGGVVFGPATETTIEKMRKAVPARFPIRRYPDITHSKNCQYEVRGWDNALENTLGREPINPRPRAFAKIFRKYQQYAIGFISYSEGCNDDLNKVVWSCLGWDPDMKVDDILVEYSRYFISERYEDSFAKGLLGLERNWHGRFKDDDGVYETLQLFQAMESKATPQDKLNWRFQQGLYRAYYDAYIKARLAYETRLEKEALSILKTAGEVGSAKALDAAEAVLDKAETYKNRSKLRARVFELAEALFQSIGMQLSVPRYRAKQIGRGANLDMVDIPLNHSMSLKEAFANVRKMRSEKQKLAKIAQIAAGRFRHKDYNWEKIFEKKFIAEGVMIDD